MVAYLQDNEFMGFVENAYAEEIKGSARDAGYEIEDYGSYFHIIFAPRSQGKGKTMNRKNRIDGLSVIVIGNGFLLWD